MAGAIGSCRELDSRIGMSDSGGMTVELASDVEDFLQKQMRNGACADVADLVNDVLRSVRDQQLMPFKATPELEAWLLESADTPATSLTRADFDAIRSRVRARAGS